MFSDKLATKEDFQKLIKHLRKHISRDSAENIHDMYKIVQKHRYDIWFNKDLSRFVDVFGFEDGFHIEATDDVVYLASIVLFYELDLMKQDTEMEIKKENDIWHFDSDLAQYFPNGKIMRSLTVMNHFRPKLRKLLSSFKDIEYYSAYCYDAKSALKEMCTRIDHIPNSLTKYYYKFDNGLEIILSDYEIESISKVLTDSI